MDQYYFLCRHDVAGRKFSVASLCLPSGLKPGLRAIWASRSLPRCAICRAHQGALGRGSPRCPLRAGLGVRAGLSARVFLSILGLTETTLFRFFLSYEALYSVSWLCLYLECFLPLQNFLQMLCLHFYYTIFFLSPSAPRPHPHCDLWEGNAETLLQVLVSYQALKESCVARGRIMRR